MGQIIHYEYNSDNRLKKVTYGTGEVIEYTSPEWVNAGNGTEESSVAVEQSGLKVKRGLKSVEIVPAANGQIQSVRKNNGEVIQLEHDENDQISALKATQTGKTAQQYALKYDSMGHISEERNEMNGTKTQTKYNERGQKIYEKDPEGRETHWVYNAHGELMEEQYGGDKATYKSYEYYDTGAHRGLKKSQQESGATAHYTYDAQGNLATHTKGNAGEANHEKTSFERDKAGNILKKTEGDHLRQTSYTYDAFNEILTVAEARGTSRFSYDQFRRKKTLTDPLGRQFVLELNDQDLLTKKTLPNGLSWGFAYNQERQLSEKTNPKGEKITYGYGSKGKFRKETLPDGLVNQKKYTENEALLWAKNKYLRFTTIFDENGHNQGFDYIFNGQAPIQIRFKTDKTGRKESISAKRPNHRKQAFDENNRQITSKIDLNDPSDIAIEKNAAGKVTKITKGALSNELVYDAAGNLTDMVQKGRITETTSNQDLLQRMVYAYDDRGQLVSITGGDFGVSFEYEVNGQLKALVRQNNTRTAYDFHASGKIAGIQEQMTPSNAPVTPISTHTYHYNTAGDCTQWQKDQQTWALGYDANDQLTAATTAGQSYTYAYDQVGNRVQRNQEILSYDAQSLQCTSNDAWHFAYDANGNLATKTSKTNGAIQQHFSYNALGQLTAFRAEDGGATPAIEATYNYGGAGRRIGKQVSYRDTPERSYTRWYVYDQDNILLELDEHFQPVRQYIHALSTDSIIGFIENKQAYYLSKDAFGNVIGILDASGAWVTRYAYDPFGVPEAGNDDSAIQVPFRFASREWDEESDTYFFRNRQYDPTLGRFLQPDPHPGNPEDPVSIFCPYAYARNNPLKYADPYGLLFFLIAGLLFVLKFAVAVVVGVIGILLASLALAITAGLAGMILSLPLGLIGGLIGGIVSQIRGDGFRAGFIEGFQFGASLPSFVAGYVGGSVIGAAFGAALGVVGFLTNLVRGQNVWEGMREGFRTGWNLGIGITTYAFGISRDYLLYLLNYVLPQEFNLDAYNERFASFLTYSTIQDFSVNLGFIQDRLPQGFIAHSVDDTQTDNMLPNTHSRMYTAYDNNFDSTLVVFTATDSAQDWIENVLGQLVTRVNWPHVTFEQALLTPQVGFGFWRDYDSLRERLFERLDEIDRITGTNDPIFVTGFSLGGALAVLAGLEIAQLRNREVHVYAIASPRVGNPTFVNLFRGEVTSAHKLITMGDPVPGLPLQIQGYTEAPLIRRFEEDRQDWFVFDRHTQETYLENILADIIGLNTRDEIDFANPDVINYLTQIDPHAFDFFPLTLFDDILRRNINLEDAVSFLTTVGRTYRINGIVSKNSPVLG